MSSVSRSPSLSNYRNPYGLHGSLISHLLLVFTLHLTFALAQEISDIPGYQSLPSCAISGLSAVLTPGGVPNPDCVATITAPVSIASCACLEIADSLNVNNLVYDTAFACGSGDGVGDGGAAKYAFGQYCSLFQESFAVLLASATATFSSFNYQVTDLPGFFGIPRCARSAMVSAFEPGGFTMCPITANPSAIASCACSSTAGLSAVQTIVGSLGNGCGRDAQDSDDVNAAFSSYCALYTRQTNIAKAGVTEASSTTLGM